MFRKLESKLFNLKRGIKKLITKWVKIPYANYVQAKIKAKQKALIISEFEKSFGTHPDKIKQMMSRSEKAGLRFVGKNPAKLSYDEYRNFLKEQLIKNAKEINDVCLDKSPAFYSPEIIEIHNENVYGRIGKSLNKLIVDDNKETQAIIQFQNKRLDEAWKNGEKDWFKRTYGRNTNFL